MYEKYENRSDEPRRAHVDQNQGKAVTTGFHSETSESEVIQHLKESITEIVMTIENARIECPAKPITHALIHFRNDDERNKYIRSANMLKKELRGRKLKITRSMDAEERFHLKRMRYVKYCTHVEHNVLLDSITTNWTLKHVSVKGQIVVKTCQSGNLKYIKHQDIETEVEGRMEKWQSKNSSQRQGAVERGDKNEGTKEGLRVVKCKQRHRETNEATEAQVKEAAGTSSKKSIETFQHAYNNDDYTKNEDLKGRGGGGRLKHYNVDGDVPLCVRKPEEKSKDGRMEAKANW